MKIHVKTLGCRLNQAESERIARGFALVGHEIVGEAAAADLLVLNSCTVTARAARESVRAARHRPAQRLIVTGCHSEVAPDAFPGADLIVASAEKENLVALAGAALISYWAFGIPPTQFARAALESMLFRDIVAGTLKSFLFGLIISMVSCYKGLTVRGGAAGVGDATTTSVVTAITTVIGFDTLFNIVLVALFDK